MFYANRDMAEYFSQIYGAEIAKICETATFIKI